MDDKRTSYPDARKREVYALIKRESEEKDKWVRCGIGFVNRDESITLVLDTLPAHGGRLMVRRWESHEEKERRFAARRNGQAGAYAGASNDNHDSDSLFGSSHG